MTMFNLEGKTALVTGASSGFGAHFSKILIENGASVVIGARRKNILDEHADKLNALVKGTKAKAVTLDVTDRQQVIHAFDVAEQSFGTVDIIVNNAGISPMNHCLQDSEEDYDRMMEVNQKAVWRVATEGAKRLVAANKSGSIINISSIMGLNASPYLSLYCTSKAAVAQLTKALAMDLWSKNIRVNALCPGFFPTEINGDFMNSADGQKYISRTPAKRTGRLDEISGPFLLLASDASSFMNGALIPVDGGHSARML